jgi:hypothetical protein
MIWVLFVVQSSGSSYQPPTSCQFSKPLLGTFCAKPGTAIHAIARDRVIVRTARTVEPATGPVLGGAGSCMSAEFELLYGIMSSFGLVKNLFRMDGIQITL